MLIRVICAHCRKPTKKERGQLRRSRRHGMKIYCSLRCAGLARRKPKKSKKQRAEEKRLYDIEYRRKNRAAMKRKKRLYHLRTYDPVKAAKVRKQNMKRHVEYCRRPEYKRWKLEYDRKYRALKFFGPFAEAYLLLGELNKHIAERITDYETRQKNDTGNKAQKRRRADGAETCRHRHKTIDGESPEGRSLGDIERHQDRADVAEPRRCRGGSGQRNPADHQNADANRGTEQAAGPDRDHRVFGKAVDVDVQSDVN